MRWLGSVKETQMVIRHPLGPVGVELLSANCMHKLLYVNAKYFISDKIYVLKHKKDKKIFVKIRKSSVVLTMEGGVRMAWGARACPHMSSYSVTTVWSLAYPVSRARLLGGMSLSSSDQCGPATSTICCLLMFRISCPSGPRRRDLRRCPLYANTTISSLIKNIMFSTFY